MNKIEKYIFSSTIDQSSKAKWITFYNSHKQNNVFQTFDMFNFWSNLKNYKVFILLVESINEECLGFCIGAIIPKGKSKTKNPNSSAVIYGGPLIKNDDRSIFNFFIKKAEKYLKFKSKYIEFRNFRSDLIFKNEFVNIKWKYTPKLNILVGLDSENEVFNDFSASRRREIRKAYKEGVKISYDKTKENIEGVYKILLEIFRVNDKIMALPIPNLTFLSNLLLMNNARILTLRYDNKIIGGAFFLYDDKRIYHWFRGGLHREYNKQSPDAVIDWEVMKFGIENNLLIFDFMGAGTKGQDNRLRTYKSRFGGDLVEIGMYSKINFPLLFRIENKLHRMKNGSETHSN